MRAMLVGLLLGVALWVTPAHAGQIFAGGPIYGSPDQETGVCYIFNAGETAIVITSIAIYDEVANDYPVVSNNCGASLAKHRSCRTVSRIFGDSAYSCRAVVGSATNLRGSFELRDA